jgi:PPM family protein phosphatase
MSLEAFALSDVGKSREENEDAFYLLPYDGVFIVADGMGGHNGGAEAARLVVEQLPGIIHERLDSIPARRTKALALALRDALVEVSLQVLKEGNGSLELEGMGATVVLAYRRKSRLYVAHMGDSRAYLYRDGKLEQLTKDHSVIAMMLEDGEITPEEAKTHPARGIVTRFAGMEGTVYPDVTSLKCTEGDRLLLCSDGLNNMLTDEAITEILSGGGELQKVCRSLVDAANEAGGRDNITVLIANLYR